MKKIMVVNGWSLREEPEKEDEACMLPINSKSNDNLSKWLINCVRMAVVFFFYLECSRALDYRNE